ncbi:hypothetical protein ACFQ3N_05195 [Virgibacillus byunsanensis]|uniref:Uncharacterized protein n=1 Tax=Virgibacillus byunsanensis TaxID=570945 RepID=A0ABW3LJY3_9BACI
MNQTVLLYLSCILAGFALTRIPASSVVSSGIVNFFDIVGGIAIIIFAIALLHLGVKALLGK